MAMSIWLTSRRAVVNGWAAIVQARRMEPKLQHMSPSVA
jgi:hypothetical protein